jgi:hypothetical protein
VREVCETLYGGCRLKEQVRALSRHQMTLEIELTNQRVRFSRANDTMIVQRGTSVAISDRFKLAILLDFRHGTTHP